MVRIHTEQHVSFDAFTRRSDGFTAQAARERTVPPPALAPQQDVYQGPPSAKIETPAPAGVSTPDGWVFPSDRPILLYNSDCSVCRKISSWVITSDDPKNGGKQLIDERPIGYDPEALKKLNPQLDIWNAYETIHLLMPDGSIKTGGEAVGEVFRRLPQTAWSGALLDLSLFGWRPFQSMVNTGYTVLDKLRPALGCESCGTNPPWWGMPIAWAVKGWKRVFGSGDQA